MRYECPMPIVLSVKPKWASLIRSGQKDIEVRTQALPREHGLVYMYETKPIGQITAKFWIDEIIESDWRVWGIGYAYLIHEQYKERTCLTDEELYKYVNGKYAHFHVIKDMTVLDEPLTIEDVGLTRAPQSWCYAKKWV